MCDVLVVRRGEGVAAAGRPTTIRAVEEEPSTVESLTWSECWSLLRSAAVGRLAVVAGGRLDIFPVNHVVHGESVVFRTVEGAKLDAAAGRDVAFEVDGFDSRTGRAWSVVLKGRAKELRERDEVLRAFRLPILPWQEGP